MYEFIFLDLDDTILDFTAAEDAALPKGLREVGIEPTPELISRYKQINISEWERFERGEISRETVLTERYEILFREFNISASAEAAEDAYRKYLAVGHYFIDGAVELLDDLKRKNYRLFLASNGVAATQDSRLDSAGIRPYFENIFISETTGHHKPEPEYFAYCFARIPGFDCKKALMVGDSLTSDILGGKRAGMDTCWFNPHGKPVPSEPKPDYIVTSLSELRNIL